MTDEFDLIIDYRGEQKHFPARLLLQGYTHKFKVIIDNKEVSLERDEEGSYRALLRPRQDEIEFGKIDRNLLRAIQEKIESIVTS
jgi:hypothetical protein